jgi:hypothetical protein
MKPTMKKIRKHFEHPEHANRLENSFKARANKRIEIAKRNAEAKLDAIETGFFK